MLFYGLDCFLPQTKFRFVQILLVLTLKNCAILNNFNHFTNNSTTHHKVSLLRTLIFDVKSEHFLPLLFILSLSSNNYILQQFSDIFMPLRFGNELFSTELFSTIFTANFTCCFLYCVIEFFFFFSQC